LAILINIYLIFKLSFLTLIRFAIWITLGFLIYFFWGIKNSLLERIICSATSANNCAEKFNDKQLSELQNAQSETHEFVKNPFLKSTICSSNSFHAYNQKQQNLNPFDPEFDSK